MGLSDEWTDWHLTPRGWERGNGRRDFGISDERPIPPDTVSVWRHQERVSSMYSKLEQSESKVRDVAEPATIGTLMAKFGPCPKHL